MRVLLTNAYVANPTGSELYVRDVALALQARGHQPVIFSTRLGKLAEDLRRRSIMVTDDLTQITLPPDIIHGQHQLETMAALLHFPNVPCLAVIHGWLPWQEMPVHFPRVLHYAVVSQTVYDSLVSERGILPEKISLLLNFVDLDRFKPRQQTLPEKPRRAAIFSGVLGRAESAAIVREACRQRNIEVESFGYGAGHFIPNPEVVLHEFDLVFAIGRAAIESIAMGNVVVVARPSGLVGQVTTANYEALRLRNFDFGAEIPPKPLTVESVLEAIDAYDPVEAQLVCQRLRAEAGIQHAVDRLIGLYEQVLEAWSAQPSSDPLKELQAASKYISWFTARYPDGIFQRLTDELHAAHIYLQELEKNSRAHAEEIEQARSYIQRLELDLALQVQQRQAEQTAHAEEIEQARAYIQRLEAERTAYAEEIEQARSYIQRLELDLALQIQQRQAEQAAHAEEIEQARAYIQRLEAERTAHAEEIEQARSYMQRLELDLARQTQQNQLEQAAHAEEIEQARAYIQRLEAERTAHAEAIEQARSYMQRLELDLARQTQQNQLEQAAHAEEIERARAYIQRLEAERTAHAEEIEQARSYIQRLELDLALQVQQRQAEQTAHAEEIEQARAYIQHIEQESSARAMYLQQAEAQLAVLQQTLDERQQALNALQETVQSLSQQVLDWQGQAAHHQRELADLKEKLAESEAARAALEADLGEAHKTIERLQLKLNAYRVLD